MAAPGFSWRGVINAPPPPFPSRNRASGSMYVSPTLLCGRDCNLIAAGELRRGGPTGVHELAGGAPGRICICRYW